MGKKNNIVLIILAVLIILVVGGVLIFRRQPTGSTTSPSGIPKSTAVVNNAVVITKTNSTLGNYLAEPSGLPLYTYEIDTSDVSNCTQECLASWPPYQDTGSTTSLPADIGVLTRPDTKQVQFTFKGLPLYTFANDTPGNPTGNNVSNFQVAKP